MSKEPFTAFLSASWKSSVALVPLAIACAQISAHAQATPAPAKTQAQLAAEAAAAKAAAAANDPAAADDAAAAAISGNATGGKDIVVTGTSIRGVAPTGTQLITVGEQEIKASGATSVSQVLATIPQIGGMFFNNIPQAQTADSTSAGTSAKQFSGPQLRPAPAGSDTGTSTLVLLNGTRQAAIGVNQAVGNADSVPPALLERVEVNTDGGSAIYGSDAIGGVINFVTRRKFDGLQVGGHFGFGQTGYKTYDGTVIAGKDWGSGSAYISYNYAHQDTLFGSERPWFKPIDFSTGLQTGLNCDTPNIRINAIATTTTTLHYYASTSSAFTTTPFTTVAPATGTPNTCSLNTKAALANGFERHNVLGSFAQDFGDSVKLTVRSRYSQNDQSGNLAPVTYAATVTQDNPFWRQLTGTADSAVTSYTVLGNFSGAVGPDARKFTSGTKQYGATADLSWDISHNWQFRATANWDQSRSQYENATGGITAPGFEGTGGVGTAANPLANATVSSPATACEIAVIGVHNAGGRLATTPAALAAIAAAQAACYNPFNIAASNPALISQIATQSTLGRGRDRIINFKGVLDGALFTLPGGKVRLAVGTEYLNDDFAKGIATGTIGANPVTLAEVKQNIYSAFFELNVPLVSSANSMPLLRELRLSASGRYDHYTQSGGTFNPRFGATWKPFDWVSIRGTWGKSFRAPTTIDLLGMSLVNTTISQFPLAVLSSFGAIDPARQPLNSAQNQILVLQGTNPNETPQHGRNWSIGADFTPLKGLRATVTYYHNTLLNQIGAPIGIATFPNFPQLATVYPTQAQYTAFTKGFNTAGLTTDISTLYALYDFRSTNLGNSIVSGIDYSVRYNHNFDWGSAYITASGNIQLVNETQISAVAPFVSNIGPTIGALNNAQSASGAVSLHHITVQTGINTKNVQASVTLTHNDGFKLTPTTTLLSDHVAAFNVVNMYLSYTFTGEHFYNEGVVLSLSVNNVFNQAPPEIRSTTGQQNGFTNGSTLGRLFQFGIQKKF